MQNESKNAEVSYEISADQLEKVKQDLRVLYKERVLLQQAVQEQKEQDQANKEELFLELLELFDALESLISYSENDPNPNFFQRLPKSLKSVQKKLLVILGRREVKPIEYQENKADFSICRVVDCEIRDDVEEQTITKIVRRGFKLHDKLLRSMDVITAKKATDQKTTD